MVNMCFYFQVHQPFRMKNYSIFNIGKDNQYFDDEKNKEIAIKVANKCYLPTNRLLLKLIKQHPEFKIAFSISGVALEQFEQYCPEVLTTFKELADTGNAEFLNETYYHSLSFIFSKEEFKEQVLEHKKKIKELFGVEPTVFRNTELIYNNELGNYIGEMGFKGIITEGADKILGWKSPNFVYKVKGSDTKLLLKNYKLSDDIAFRFSNKGWNEHPLTTEKFCKWVNKINGNGTCVNLFMDYETFGEHQWEDTGIFQFLEHLPGEFLKHPDNSFKTPSELIEGDAVDEVDIHDFISWADLERDLSAWMGNNIQDSALAKLYQIEKEVKASGDAKLIKDWKKLTTSDHFYYMCTKWFSDGDVHKYFNPYDSPYDSFINFMNILKDIETRLGVQKSEKLS